MIRLADGEKWVYRLETRGSCQVVFDAKQINTAKFSFFFLAAVVPFSFSSLRAILFERVLLG